MTRSQALSISELVELASLDAFGLLDAEDALEFEEAFLAAPSRIRDSIRSLQAELASDENLLGSEEPDESLRAKVLQRVAEAMAEHDSTLQPIASIGPSSYHQAHMNMESPNFLRSIWTWRAVALMLLGVTITLAVHGIVRNNEYNDLIQAINSRQGQFVLNQPPGIQQQIAWPSDNGEYQIATLVDANGAAGRVRILLNPDGTNPRIAYDLDRRLPVLTIFAIDDDGEFGPAGSEYVVATLNPKQTSSDVAEGFNSDWIGNTRLIARDAAGRDILIQV
jgi:hypothetical protein